MVPVEVSVAGTLEPTIRTSVVAVPAVVKFAAVNVPEVVSEASFTKKASSILRVSPDNVILVPAIRFV